MSDSNNTPRVVVGLGNPGAKYRGTRHNVGFDVLDALASQLNTSMPTSKFDGQLASGTFNEQKILLVWPLTYMNNSGRCAAAVAKFYKSNPERDMMVICDDLSLPLGKIRIRPKGSAGGQKGLQDILRAVGTQSVARLRIGIDPAPPQWETADYVLGKFRNDEKDTVAEAIKTACDAILDWATHDLAHCMNQFN